MSDTAEEGGSRENISEAASESDVVEAQSDYETDKTDEQLEGSQERGGDQQQEESVTLPHESTSFKMPSKTDDEESSLISDSETEMVDGFSAYERSEQIDYPEQSEDIEAAPTPEGSGGFLAQPSYIADAIETFSEVAPTASSLFKHDSRMPSGTKEKKTSDVIEDQRSFAIEDGDEELSSIPVPAIKPSKVVPKVVGPKYPLWPLKIFETEKIYSIMESAVPRFFPRNYPYHSRNVPKRLNLLTQYIQKKVYQMGFDRRKIITVVRYQQKNWHGQRSVVRWLWCMETDAMATYVQHGEDFVVSVVVAGLYID